VLGEGDHRPLADVYHVFRRLDLSDAAGGEERLTRAFSAWGEALAASGIDLRLERRALYGLPFPRADWRANPGVAPRPWDVELTALVAGLRKIAKLDGVPPDLVESLRSIVEQRGLRVEVVTPKRAGAAAVNPSASTTLLVARDASGLDEARHLEALLLVAGGSQDVTAQMGALLGYPRCCSDRFMRIAEQNDTTLAWALLPGVPHPPASPLTQWLQPGSALLSHSPCDLHCAASIALGERLLEEIEGAQRGFTEIWRALTTRVQVVDRRSNRLALAVDGRLDVGATITAVDVLASGGGDVHACAQQLVGRTVRSDCGGLVIADDDWYAPFVADHRGQP
jgi:hypothetical protein